VHFPDELRYTAEHEWIRVEGDAVTIGITDFAQDSLGDVVYVALPQTGERFETNASCAEVESTKSVSEIYAPVAGTVAATNQALSERPELVNLDPYGEGWMVRFSPIDVADLTPLLDADAYRALVE
jgi:glycine cleavage system H protein